MPYDDDKNDGSRCPICGSEDCSMDTMCIYTPPGTGIVFLNKNGHDAEGQRYEVEYIDVDSWSSAVRLAGVNGTFGKLPTSFWSMAVPRNALRNGNPLVLDGRPQHHAMRELVNDTALNFLPRRLVSCHGKTAMLVEG